MNEAVLKPWTDCLEAKLPEAMAWLKRMVEINSFTANAVEVDRLGGLTAECFAGLGFRPEFARSTHPDYGSHLFLSRKGSGGLPLVLVTHLDTVYPPDEEKNDFHWREDADGKRIYGPGTVDIKGGTVLIWLMLHALKAQAPGLFEKIDWLIAANSSEEVIGADFYERTKERCPQGVTAVLVFEGGQRDQGAYQVVTARKGRAEYRVSASGKGAHAGSYHADGINAIVALAECVQKAARITDYSRELTVNVAQIQGGTVLNRVPHEAHFDLEMRAYDPATLESAQRLVEAMDSGPARAGGASIRVECLGRTPAWPPAGPDTPLLNCWKEAAEIMGLTISVTQRGGLSDANYLRHLGPTLDGLGPAGANAHCSERSADGSKTPEFVERDSFVPKAALDALAICRLMEKAATS